MTKNTHGVTAERMADQNIGPRHFCAFEKRVQLGRDLLRRARHRSFIAPTVTCAIVGTDARQFGDFGLHHAPVSRPPESHGIQYDRWTAFSRAMKVQPITTNIDELSGRRVAAFINRCGDGLIRRTDQDNRDCKPNDSYEALTNPTHSVPSVFGYRASLRAHLDRLVQPY